MFIACESIVKRVDKISKERICLIFTRVFLNKEVSIFSLVP